MLKSKGGCAITPLDLDKVCGYPIKRDEEIKLLSISRSKVMESASDTLCVFKEMKFLF